jgi:hypothetical protein
VSVAVIVTVEAAGTVAGETTVENDFVAAPAGTATSAAAIAADAATAAASPRGLQLSSPLIRLMLRP